MWSAAGINLLAMDDLRPADFQLVDAAAKAYEQAMREQE